METLKTWTVVKFEQEDTVEAVPTTWIVGQHCYWPTYTTEKVIAAIRNHESANTCWPIHEISLFRNGTFDSYIEARQRSKVAEYDSSDYSEGNKDTRKIRKKRVVSTSEDEISESRIADPPQRKSSNVKSYVSQKDKYSLPTIIESSQPQRNSEVTYTDNDLQLNSNATSDIILDFECGCCPVHNRFDMEQLSTLKEDLQKTFTENFKTMSRKLNVLTSIVYDLVTEVGKISEEIKNIKFGNSDPAIVEYHSIFKKFDLPIESDDKFKEFEEFVSVEQNFTATVHEISKIGGSSPYDFIKRIFGGLLTNEMTVKYTWLGTKDKKALAKTKFAEVLLQSSVKCCDSWDTKQMEDAIKKYLRRAKERIMSASNKK